jgi:hypothetical protein
VHGREAAFEAPRFSYERMGAQITEVEGASHVVLISHPKETAEVVMTAASACAAAGLTCEPVREAAKAPTQRRRARSPVDWP